MNLRTQRTTRNETLFPDTTVVRSAAWRPTTRKAVPAHCETLERQRDWPHERPQGGRTGNSWAAARWRTWKGRALDCFAFVVIVLLVDVVVVVIALLAQASAAACTVGRRLPGHQGLPNLPVRSDERRGGEEWFSQCS